MLNGMFEVETTEAFAVKEGILLARERGLNHVVIELDSLSVVQAINSNSIMGESGSIFQGIIGFLRVFGSWKLKHLKWDFNRATHELAQLAKAAGVTSLGKELTLCCCKVCSSLIGQNVSFTYFVLSPLCCTSISDLV